ncbi:TRAP transporter small permease [Acuticoccus yangtzensis]|uniref:TRAP transporter small permease n=1 Tax=Acuticoccus yangtzensis TaxID=1443441 RepID=UPI000A4FB69C|nr:TRAP transporter small permease subunit [Acuticoccus yangtzensis]
MPNNHAGPGAHRPAGGAATAAHIVAVLVRLWAILGGLIATGLAVMTAASAVSNLLFAAPFAADHELIKHLVAVVIFMFLPYCQLFGANVTVDIFTEAAGPRTKALMAAFAALFAVAFSALLVRQMSLGMADYMDYVEVTPVLKLPLWTAFPPILVSLALLLAAAIMTFADSLRAVAGRASWFAEEGR